MRYSIDRAVVLNQIWSGTDVYTYVCDWRGVHDILYTFNSYRTHYIIFTAQSFEIILCIWFICAWLVIQRYFVVSIVVKLINMDKFVMWRYLRRAKDNAYGNINKISEALASMRFWVQARGFHVWSCVYCDKYSSEVIIMYSSDKEVKSSRLKYGSNV